MLNSGFMPAASEPGVSEFGAFVLAAFWESELLQMSAYVMLTPLLFSAARRNPAMVHPRVHRRNPTLSTTVVNAQVHSMVGSLTTGLDGWLRQLMSRIDKRRQCKGTKPIRFCYRRMKHRCQGLDT